MCSEAEMASVELATGLFKPSQEREVDVQSQNMVDGKVLMYCSLQWYKKLLNVRNSSKQKNSSS